MSGHSGSGVTNFITFLQSRNDGDPIDPAAANPPTVMQKVELLPLPDVLDAPGVTVFDAPNLVVRSRTRGLVELVREERMQVRFLRLIPRGFDKASASGIPISVPACSGSLLASPSL